MRWLAAAVIAALVGGATSARAQEVARASATPQSCTYHTCALSIAPTWNGLGVVRGAEGTRVATLGFFIPTDITAVLRGTEPNAPGADSAAMHARRAVVLRRIGAALTDVGGVTAAIIAVRAARQGALGSGERALAGVAVAALAVSVPLQFAADGALSRAVWWHNERYGR